MDHLFTSTTSIPVSQEDVETMHEVDGQFGPSSFDYSRWQRTPKASANAVKHLLPLPDLPAEASSSSSQEFLVQKPAQPTPVLIEKKIGKRGPSARKAKKHHPKTLEMLIAGKRKALKEYEERWNQLLYENYMHRNNILGDEDLTHIGVKGMLRKYERLRGGMCAMHTHVDSQRARVKRETDDTRSRLQEEVAALQKEVDTLDGTLMELETELQFLLTYKDKEYPVKFMRISELQKKISRVRFENETSKQHLDFIMSYEMTKLQNDEQMKERDLLKVALQSTIGQLHPSLREMAGQNLILEKEIVFHEKEAVEVFRETQAVKEALSKLHKKTVQQPMTANLMPLRKKCSPDDDIILDIPTHECLPI